MNTPMQPLAWYEDRASEIDRDAEVLDRYDPIDRMADTLRNSAAHIRTLATEVERLRGALQAGDGPEGAERSRQVRWCSCGQPWLPAVGLFGTTEETRCPGCVLRELRLTEGAQYIREMDAVAVALGFANLQPYFPCELPGRIRELAATVDRLCATNADLCEVNRLAATSLEAAHVEMAQTATCPLCGGSGSVAKECGRPSCCRWSVDCPHCHGKGKVLA